MNAHFFHTARSSTTALLFLSIVIGNCARSYCENNRESSSADKSKIVRPGFGLPECHIGMPIKDLRGDWRAPASSDPYWRKTYLSDRSAGLEVKHDGERILGVIVNYHSDGYKTFLGMIEGGIGAESSIEQVIHAKGQPTTIGKTEGEKGEYTDLTYFEEGIRFDFLNKKLRYVAVSRPLKDVPPPLKKDIGDTAAYRAIRPDKK